PAPLFVLSRQSPAALVTLGATNQVTFDDPPRTSPGMTSVHFDARGRLLEFLAVPPARDDSEESARTPEWSVLLDKAGLDSAQLTPAQPTWNPPVTCDAR